MKLIDITPFIRYAAEIKYNSPGKYLYVCHMNPSSKDFRTPIAKIVLTAYGDTIGIQNDSGEDFYMTYQGRRGVLQSGREFPLFPGMVLELGKTTIIVK